MSLLNQLFSRGVFGTKCKTSLNLAISRIKLLQNKRDMQLKHMRKEIAQFLQAGQEAIARIRVEHVIREQNMWAAYEILELFCEFVLARVPIIESQRKTLEDSLLRQGHSGIRNGEPKHPAVVVQEGKQKNYGIVGIRNGEHKHPAVVVPEGQQRNYGFVNKGKEKISEFQNLKIPNSSRNQCDFSDDLPGKETAGFGVEVMSVINGIVTNGIKGKFTLDIFFLWNVDLRGSAVLFFQSFLGHIGSIQKPKAQQPASSLRHNHVTSPSVVLPNVPSVSSLSHADPKSHIPAEVVPVNVMVISSFDDDVACSDTGKSESAIQIPKVSFEFLEPQVLNPAPTRLLESVLVNEVRNYEKLENSHADLVSSPQISAPTCINMVVSESNSDVDSALVQQQIKQLLFDNAVDLNKSRGFSDKWVLLLELGDGRRVVVPMEIER
ncbi:hypothetical protein CMV_000002 [Castanea mollissima]|uniref:IST1-like protein n=1 Tax=Castanea mollissima TaxID=60419 RepID=A0A8J4W7P0_9ROSI|nr:hypothetical protein CMV_000002 [Castanea mollissima]